MSSIKILEDYISDRTRTDFFVSQKNSYTVSNPNNEEIRANRAYKILVIKTYRDLAQEKWESDKKNHNSVEGAGYNKKNNTAFQPGAQLQSLAKHTDNDINKKTDSKLNEYIDTLAEDSKKDFNAINKKPLNQAVSSVSNLKTKSSSIISFVKGLSGAVLAPIGFGLVVAESGIRTGLTCLSCLGYGVLKIAEKLESTSLARKVFGNNEFGIQGAREHTLFAITNLVGNNYTLGAIDSYFFSNGSQESSQKKEKLLDNKGLKEANGPFSKNPSFNYKKPNHSQSKNLERKGGEGYSGQGNIRMAEPIGSYYEAYRSGDKTQITKAEDFRRKAHGQEEKRREEEKIRKEEERQKKAPKNQCSPLTRNPPASSKQRNRPLRGPSNSRPSPDPGRPLKATQAHQSRNGQGHRP